MNIAIEGMIMRIVTIKERIKKSIIKEEKKIKRNAPEIKKTKANLEGGRLVN